QQAPWLPQGVTAEGIAKLLRHHHLDDGRLALLHLGIDRLFERLAHLFEVADSDTLGAERAGDLRPGRVLEVHALEAAIVEVHLVLLLRAPLLVVEDDSGDGNVLAHASEDLAEAHAPGA